MFEFKRFAVYDDRCAMKVGTDAVILGSWVDVTASFWKDRQVFNNLNIIDAGCGSAILSLMMAQRSPYANIIAVDIDREACKDAEKNVGASPWSDRIKIVCADISEQTPEMDSPKLIISNPPYFKEPLQSPDALRAQARHGNGFDVRTLIELSVPHLIYPCDSLAFISPAERESEIDFILSVNRLIPVRKTSVYSNPRKAPIRILWQVAKDLPSKYLITNDTLLIRDTNNDYTEQYVALTSQFYLHLN